MKAPRLGLLRLGLLAAVLLASSSWAPVGYGGNTWDGGGDDNNWTTGRNWNPATGTFQIPPLNNGFADVVMAGTTRLTPIVDVPYSIRSLTFDNTAGAFTILGVEELTIGAGGITNNDSQLQSVIGPVKLAADQIWTAAAGRLQTDVITLNGFDLGLAGARQIDLPNIILGAGDITLADSYTSTVTMVGPGNNTYSGHTGVLSGTLVLQKGGVAVPGDLTISSGGTVRLAGNEQIAETAGNEVVVLGGGLLDVNTRTETLAKLTINGGSATVTGLGKLTAAEALVTGATASWNNAGNLYIGVAGTGTLNVGSGATVTAFDQVILGQNIGSAGTVSVSGIGSSLAMNTVIGGTNVMYIGRQGSGLLNVTNSGAVSNTHAYIGDQSGSMGEVTVDGGNSTWTIGGSLYVGKDGDGTLEITGGGSVLGVSGFLPNYIGYGNGSTGTVTVAGAASMLSNGDASIGRLAGSTGAVTVDGADSRWHVLSDWTQLPLAPGGDLSIGHQGNGTLEITNGGRVRSENGKIGAQPGSVGLVRVSGAASAWSMEYSFYEAAPGSGLVSGGGLEVGVEGEGTLEVLDDAGLGSWTAYIGENGLVRVDGAGSTWILNSASVFSCAPNQFPTCVLIEGDQFGGYVTVNGELEITNGALVRGARDVGGPNDFSIISSIGWGSEGRVLVDGAGSKWDGALSGPSGPYGYGIDLLVGRTLLADGEFTSGSGILDITNGGWVETAFGAIGSANTFSSNATGVVTVDGNGSTWFCEELVVGRFGTGELAVRNGGYVAVGHLSTDIGLGGTGTGHVTVEGAGTVFRNADLYLGRDGGSGLLEVIDGGEVTVLGDFVVYSLGEIRGDGNIIGNVENGGLVSPGTSPGALNIDGDYTQTAAGELLIELASATSYDQLLITGEATLGGTLQVSLLGGFTPSVGQSFTILTSPDVSLTFGTEMLPFVPGRIFDVIYNPQSVVLTVLPAFTADFDEDGDVDAADLLQWQGDFGVNALSDADNDGDSDGADFLAWQQQLGGGVPAVSANVAVPEPATAAVLTAIGLAAMAPISPRASAGRAVGRRDDAASVVYEVNTRPSRARQPDASAFRLI